MICEATFHAKRVPSGPALATKLMRVDNPCRGESKVTALCEVCYRDDLRKIKYMHYICPLCFAPHTFRTVWKMIGDA